MASQTDSPVETGREGDGLKPRVRHRGRSWLWLAAWAGATAFLLFFHHPFDWREIGARLASARPGWVALALAVDLSIAPLWTAQWTSLLPAGRRVRFARLWEIVTMMAAAMNTLPFLGGHALGVGLLARRGGVGAEVAVSVMALDQLCEGLAKLALLLLALAGSPLPAGLRTAAWVMTGGVLALLAVLVLLHRLHHRMDHLLTRWARHLEALRNPRALAGGLALSALMKAAEGAGILAVQHSLGVHLPLATLPLVLITVSIATMVPVAPGNLGVYEAAAFLAYRSLGLGADQALALAFIQHVCFLAALIGPGYAIMAWRALAGGGHTRKEPDAPPVSVTR